MEIYSNRYATASLTTIIATLLLLSMAFATTDTASTDATVTVNEFIDISLTPCSGGTASSIGYNSQDPGATNVKPVDCNNATDGDLKVTVEDITNVPVTIKINGSDYVGPSPSVIAIEQTEYAEVQAMTSPVNFSETPTTVWSGMGGSGSAVSDDLWFELDIPSSFLRAGIYTSTYTIDAS